MKNKTIVIIDAPCGYGKSSYAIQMINDDVYQEKKFIYVTPYLDEIDRVKKFVTSRNFTSPTAINGETKTTDLLKLLKSGANIATTHCLFQNINDEIINAIYENEYVLILDEVSKVIEKIDLKKGDIDILANSGAIEICEDGYIKWKEEFKNIELSIKEFQKIRSGALYGKLMAYKNAKGEINAIIWNFPAKVFEVFKETYILTYLFKGQLQKYYFDLHNIKYTYKSVKRSGNRYELIDYNNRIPLDKKNLKRLINLYDDPRAEEDKKPNSIKRKLSYNACTTNPEEAKPMLRQLNKDAYNVFYNIFKAKKEDVIWTMYIDAVNKKVFGFNVKGYKGNANQNARDSGCFVSHNIRATNKYKNKKTVGYLIERNLNSTYKQFFNVNNIEIHEDIWRLSEMIQFIWRSAIREGKPINLYIPSKKMRDLFKEWLDSEKFENYLENKNLHDSFKKFAS